MIKYNLKDAFCHMFMSPQDWYLLRFDQDNKTRVD